MGRIDSLLGGYGNELRAAMNLLAIERAGSIPAAMANYVTAVETGDGHHAHRTVLTLANVPQDVVNGTEYQSTKLYTFPEGRIAVKGVVATLQQKTTSALTTLNGSATGAVSLGSAPASATTLASTMINMLPSTAFTSSATVNVAGTAVNAALAAAAQIDGTTTPVPVYLNSAFATTGDVDGDATQTWSGTIVISWENLGDYL